MSFSELMQDAGGRTSPAAGGESKPVVEGRGLWTPEEHALFVAGIKLFPSGPWKDIAAHVGSRTARQTMTHAQKYRQKIARRLRNVRLGGKEHLPFVLDRSSRFHALLSSDEQFNDSILATSLAIAAERELDMLGVDGDGDRAASSSAAASAQGAVLGQPHLTVSMSMDMDMGMMGMGMQQHPGAGPDAYVKLPTAIDFSATESNPYFLDGPGVEPSDVEFDKCMDFLIETFHRETN